MDAVYYKGLMAQQHRDAFQVFEAFLKDIRPTRILEIGTADGGLTLFLRDALDFLGLQESEMVSFDINDRASYSTLKDRGVDVRLEDIFDRSSPGLPRLKAIGAWISQKGTSLVLCDGGNKVSEFITLAPFLKEGDFIMAHDYVETREAFESRFRGVIWDWCEVQERDIEESSKATGLEPFNKDNFAKVVWVCKRRVSSPHGIQSGAQ